jgi:hypothetical protein
MRPSVVFGPRCTRLESPSPQARSPPRPLMRTKASDLRRAGDPAWFSQGSVSPPPIRSMLRCCGHCRTTNFAQTYHGLPCDFRGGTGLTWVDLGCPRRDRCDAGRRSTRGRGGVGLGQQAFRYAQQELDAMFRELGISAHSRACASFDRRAPGRGSSGAIGLLGRGQRQYQMDQRISPTTVATTSRRPLLRARSPRASTSQHSASRSRCG